MEFQRPFSNIFCNIKKILHQNYLKKLPAPINKEQSHRSYSMCLRSSSVQKGIMPHTARLRLHMGLSNSYCNAVPIESFNESDNVKEDAEQRHIPVLASEVVEALRVKENGVYLDMTFGAGGHTRRILETHSSVVVYGLDRDPHARQFADVLKECYPTRFHYMMGKFSDLPKLLHNNGIVENFFDGALMDLGASSMQFDTPQRGFMLSKDGPLDMRMDGGSSPDVPTAADILAHIDEFSLYKVLKYYGQEKRARSLSRAIIDARSSSFTYFRTTKELAEFIIGVTGVERRMDKLQRFAHPATKTFQALRILVNDEMNELDCGLQVVHRFLDEGAILAAISFHSLEDTIIKRHFAGCDLDKTPDTIGASLSKHRNSYLTTYLPHELTDELVQPWQPAKKGVITPTQDEIDANPRSRSSKLRSASKVWTHSY